MLGYINVRHDVCTNDDFKQVFIISIPIDTWKQKHTLERIEQSTIDLVHTYIIHNICNQKYVYDCVDITYTVML